jgi:hypothetical protein
MEPALVRPIHRALDEHTESRSATLSAESQSSEGSPHRLQLSPVGKVLYTLFARKHSFETGTGPQVVKVRLYPLGMSILDTVLDPIVL